ncbi:MAG TPA: MjaI family restriction endonuclease [Caldisericia bacterium]|nr:MjaI family restriction endonuclease [Caldisericia bacterium]HPB33499.1 MjaI family restriction endonuclease [Caldisericia bacterium]HQL66453.1 MjaI family restriction endonuclease [Caldisericia bacterium]HQN48906.1 MjaI family restriction endonuclease [Caldisericia bacterium]
MKVKISVEEIRKYLDIETPEFPKYVAPLINLANQYAQGTRPRVVGQMSELIKEFEGKTLSDWEKWYLEKKPDAIKDATEKILQKLKELRNSLDRIDKEMVEKWVRDLVIVKTFAGLRFQEAILKKGSEIKGTNYRLAEPEEESKGVDGYIGNIPVSIKPHTYKVKVALPEHIDIKIIYYRKIDDGIEVDYGNIL